MAISLPVDSYPTPILTILLSNKTVVFYYLALADIPYTGELYLFCMTSLQFDLHVYSEF
jgi:hypothetical protein